MKKTIALFALLTTAGCAEDYYVDSYWLSLSERYMVGEVREVCSAPVRTDSELYEGEAFDGEKWVAVYEVDGHFCQRVSDEAECARAKATIGSIEPSASPFLSRLIDGEAAERVAVPLGMVTKVADLDDQVGDLSQPNDFPEPQSPWTQPAIDEVRAVCPGVSLTFVTHGYLSASWEKADELCFVGEDYVANAAGASPEGSCYLIDDVMADEYYPPGMSDIDFPGQ